MSKLDNYISVVLPLNEVRDNFVHKIEKLKAILNSNYTLHEVIVVGNFTFQDNSYLKELLKKIPGIRVLCLAKKYSIDLTVSAGVESAIGDYLVIADIYADPIDQIPDLINKCKNSEKILYGLADKKRMSLWRRFFGKAFSKYCMKHLRYEVHSLRGIFRVLHRNAANNYTIAKEQFELLNLVINNLGYETEAFDYEQEVKIEKQNLFSYMFDQINYAIEVIVATSKHPLRIMSRLGLLAAFLNIVYAGYIILVYVFKNDVAQGWVTLSMQNAAMFFMIFLVLAIVCEYLGKLIQNANNPSIYSIIDEYDSSLSVDTDDLLNIVGR